MKVCLAQRLNNSLRTGYQAVRTNSSFRSYKQNRKIKKKQQKKNPFAKGRVFLFPYFCLILYISIFHAQFECKWLICMFSFEILRGKLVHGRPGRCVVNNWLTAHLTCTGLPSQTSTSRLRATSTKPVWRSSVLSMLSSVMQKILKRASVPSGLTLANTTIFTKKGTAVNLRYNRRASDVTLSGLRVSTSQYLWEIKR